MSVTALSISKNFKKSKDFDRLIKDQIDVINSRLSSHDCILGVNTILYDLPCEIIVPGIDKKDSQKIIYSSIINNLTQRGFKVKLLLKTNLSRLYISWKCYINDDEVGAMNSVIKKSRIEESDIDKYLDSLETELLQKI
jgi:hypothetical protein